MSYANEIPDIFYVHFFESTLPLFVYLVVAYLFINFILI